MKLRIRFCGALLALLAFTAYFAEGVWASMCSPQMTGVEEVVVEDEGMPHSGAMGMHHPTSSESESPHHSDSDASGCPLGPMGAAGSCVAISLPATTTRMPPRFQVGALPSPPPAAARDLLLVAPPFHPPKA